MRIVSFIVSILSLFIGRIIKNTTLINYLF